MDSSRCRAAYKTEKDSQPPKAIIIVFWLPLDFPVIQIWPPKMTFTTKFFVNNTLPDIVAAKPACDPYR
jgi:hypothetical protein